MDEVKTETQETAQNPEELSGEALGQYLAEQQAKELGETAETEETPTAEGAETQEATDSAGEGQETTEGEPEGKQAEESEVEKLRRQIEEKEKFAQRQATELGELRKWRLEQERQRLENLNPDDFQNQVLEDPQAALERVRQQERQRAQIEQESQSFQVQENERTVKQAVPEFDSLIPDIVEIARKDGATEDAIRYFQANPYTEHAGLLINLARRAEQAREATALKAELERVKKQAEGVGQRIDQAARSKPSVSNTTGKGGTSKGVVDLTEADIDNLSGEALRSALKERLEAEQAESGG